MQIACLNFYCYDDEEGSRIEVENPLYTRCIYGITVILKENENAKEIGDPVYRLLVCFLCVPYLFLFFFFFTLVSLKKFNGRGRSWKVEQWGGVKVTIEGKKLSRRRLCRRLSVVIVFPKHNGEKFYLNTLMVWLYGCQFFFFRFFYLSFPRRFRGEMITIWWNGVIFPFSFGVDWI